MDTCQIQQAFFRFSHNYTTSSFFKVFSIFLVLIRELI